MDITRCGMFIAALRKEESMTQKQLADRLGVTDKAISRWETGKGLPDADSMLGLSAMFHVTINELLCGERSQTPQSSEQTLVEILSIADTEKKKRSRLRTIVVVLCCVFILLFAALIADDLTTGGGTTLSSVGATMQARRIAAHIEKGRFEAAANNIGFAGRDRRIAEKEWCEAMHAAFDGTLEITSFDISSLTEEDQFISGTAHLRIYDPKSDEDFVFEIVVCEQDGIAFARTVCITGDETRGKDIAALIKDTLCTYNPG